MATISRRPRKTTPAAATDDATTPDAPPTDAPVTDEATTSDAPVTDEATTPDAPDTDVPATGTDTTADAPTSGAPISGGPTGNGGDHLKIAMVAGVLAAHPHGVTASTIVDESGLRGAIVGRVLAAMQSAGAAVRKPSATPSAPELWVRGEADLTTVNIVVPPTTHTCTCGHVHKVPAPTVATGRGATIAGRNGDGQAALGKGALRDMVLAFARRHMGHDLTPTTISKELNRSSGAVRNACQKLALTGEFILVKEAPETYTAAPIKAPANQTAPEADRNTTGDDAPAPAAGTAE